MNLALDSDACLIITRATRQRVYSTNDPGRPFAAHGSIAWVLVADRLGLILNFSRKRYGRPATSRAQDFQIVAVFDIACERCAGQVCLADETALSKIGRLRTLNNSSRRFDRAIRATQAKCANQDQRLHSSTIHLLGHTQHSFERRERLTSDRRARLSRSTPSPP